MPMFAMYVLSFLAAMSLILIADKTCLCKQQRTAENQVEVAMKKLWSPDESERRDGKDELFKLGHMAVPALVSFLDEIVANPTSRNFPIGKEAEGQAAFELFYSAPLGQNPG